jgi:raffinose/stachyose/melibiose transport system permease protein
MTSRKKFIIGFLNRKRLVQVLPHLVLIPFTFLALFPISLILINSLKTSQGIFASPFRLPVGTEFSLDGYQTVFKQVPFANYFANSFIVTIAAMVLILVSGSMASFALSEYDFRGNRIVWFYFLAGIMISIRLGTVGILRLMVWLGLQNKLLSLILVYTAMGLPLTIFVLTQFMRDVPGELKDAARIDGANEYQVFFLILPLVRPAVATITTFIMVPIWNDLWFPLLLAPNSTVRTVILGAQQFLGAFFTDWQAVLAALTLAVVPTLVIYVAVSRQLIRGLTAGIGK